VEDTVCKTACQEPPRKSLSTEFFFHVRLLELRQFVLAHLRQDDLVPNDQAACRQLLEEIQGRMITNHAHLLVAESGDRGSKS
jgi:hypothetical protein